VTTALAIAINVFNGQAAFVIGRRAFGTASAGVAAATLLLSAPAHIFYSLTNPWSLVPITVALAWLWCVAEFERRNDARIMILAGGVLGIGSHSHLSAIVLTPVYLLVSLWLLVRAGQRGARPALGAVLAFLLPASIGLVRVMLEPSLYSSLIQQYRLYDAATLSPLQGAKDFLNYNNVQQRVSLYWGYFDPAYLFLTGPADIPGGTGGVLWFAGILAVPLGLFWAARRRSCFDCAVIAGFVTAPLAAILVDEAHIARRELVVIPFATFLAMAGAAAVSRTEVRRRLAIIILAIFALSQGAATASQWLNESPLQ
jgi:hypothetical protein